MAEENIWRRVVLQKNGGASSCETRTLVMPTKNIEFTLEPPVLGVCDIAMSNEIVRNILPLLTI